MRFKALGLFLLPSMLTLVFFISCKATVTVRSYEGETAVSSNTFLKEKENVSVAVRFLHRYSIRRSKALFEKKAEFLREPRISVFFFVISNKTDNTLFIERDTSYIKDEHGAIYRGFDRDSLYEAYPKSKYALSQYSFFFKGGGPSRLIMSNMPITAPSPLLGAMLRAHSSAYGYIVFESVDTLSKNIVLHFPEIKVHVGSLKITNNSVSFEDERKSEEKKIEFEFSMRQKMIRKELKR